MKQELQYFVQINCTIAKHFFSTTSKLFNTEQEALEELKRNVDLFKQCFAYDLIKDNFLIDKHEDESYYSISFKNWETFSIEIFTNNQPKI